MMSPDNQTKNTNFDVACDFIIKLGEAAHGYGSTDARLEVYLTRMTGRLVTVVRFVFPRGK
jgi:hypothetical protein